jgi:hypothetical protein
MAFVPAAAAIGRQCRASTEERSVSRGDETPRGFVVGRLLDVFDKKVCALGRSGWTFTQRVQDPDPSLDNP